MKTLLLDRSAWDCVLDAEGNWALADVPYAIAQDVASAVKLFLGELWYQTDKGVPYFENILGQFPPLELMRQKITDAALTVPGILPNGSVKVTIASFVGRAVTGQIAIITNDGQALGVTF